MIPLRPLLVLCAVLVAGCGSPPAAHGPRCEAGTSCAPTVDPGAPASLPENGGAPPSSQPEVPVCAPACSGKTCGPDGCGGRCTCSIGTCLPSGQCVTCQPQCGGRNCGPDGCGGLCGACASGSICVAGICAACTPATCASVSRNCGEMTDGCGGTLSCGKCPLGEICTLGVCQVCTPSCSGSELCKPDGCGGVCGECANPPVPPKAEDPPQGPPAPPPPGPPGN